MGWKNDQTTLLIVNAQTGSFSGLFVYSPSPGTGTLIASIAAAAGTDPFGNSYPAGLMTQQGGVAGDLLATLAAGSLTFGQHGGASLASAGLVPLSDIVLQLQSGRATGHAQQMIQVSDANPVCLVPPAAGAAVSSSYAEIQGDLALQDTGTPTPFSGGSVVYSTAGQPHMTQDSGLSMSLSGSRLANVAGTVITSTAITALGSLTVPGGDVQAGSSYLCHASGSFTTAALAPSNQRMILYWGGTGGTIIAELDPPVTAGLTGAGWFCDCEVNWLSTTSVEVAMTVGWHNGSGVAASQTFFVVVLTTALVTTGSNDLTLAWKWGSVPAGTSFVCDTIRFAKAA